MARVGVPQESLQSVQNANLRKIAVLGYRSVPKSGQ